MGMVQKRADGAAEVNARPGGVPRECVAWVNAVTAAVMRVAAGKGFDRPGHCLPYAAFTAAAVNMCGGRAVIQAGACFTRRVPVEADDPEEMFGYAWEPEGPASVFALASGMPEYHCWVGVVSAPPRITSFPASGLVLDLSVRHFPEESENGGKPWRVAVPPAAVALPAAESMTADVWYEPTPWASVFVALRVRMLAWEMMAEALTEDGRRMCRAILDAAGGPFVPHPDDCQRDVGAYFGEKPAVTLETARRMLERNPRMVDAGKENGLDPFRVAGVGPLGAKVPA